MTKMYLKSFISVAIIVPAFLVVTPASTETIVACTSSIALCGCTITEPGVYNVSATLLSSQGLTTAGGCIDIKAPNVRLFTNGFNITGDGIGTGIGIQLFRGASRAFIEAKGGSGSAPQTFTTISGWQYALKSEAEDAIVDFFDFVGNTVGLYLNGAINNTYSNCDPIDNVRYGIWLTGGSKYNQINDAIDISGNGIAGIYVGCSITGPTGTICASPKDLSIHNFFFDLEISGSDYGIALELGSSKNLIVDTFTEGDNIFDVYDGNPNCDANIWRNNLFGTANQSCIR